jgi:hypothetical protein
MPKPPSDAEIRLEKYTNGAKALHKWKVSNQNPCEILCPEERRIVARTERPEEATMIVADHNIRLLCQEVKGHG